MLLFIETNTSIKRSIPLQFDEIRRRTHQALSMAELPSPKVNLSEKQLNNLERHRNIEVLTVDHRNDIRPRPRQTNITKLQPQTDKYHDQHKHETSSSVENDDHDSFDNFDHKIKFKSIKHGLYHNVMQPDDFFINWFNNSDSLCVDEKDKSVAYHHEFAMCHDIIIDRSFATGRDGGERIEEVVNQDETVEYYTFKEGFLQMPCKKITKNYTFNRPNHMNQWMKALDVYRRPSSGVTQTVNEFTLAVTRYEYVNLYHTMTDFYNAFLLMEFFNKKQEEVNILFVDGHPKGSLDPVWSILFNSTRRISSLPMKTQFRDLVWVMQGYNSPLLDHSAPRIPYAEPFREFFLRSFNINDDHKLDCDKLQIMFIWRHNYIAHPRNPQGVVGRKIANENELIQSLQKNLTKGFNIFGVQIDKLSMRNQLEHIRKADLLIGMHGAGLTHALFLPKHAGLVELVPTYWSSANQHFEAIAKWRNLHYTKWVNSDPRNELPDKNTRIPVYVLNVIVQNMIKLICPRRSDIKGSSIYMQKKILKS